MRVLATLLITLGAFVSSTAAMAQDVPLMGLGRFDGWRENSLVGQGIVIGLPGTGDTPRSKVTRQMLRNILMRLGTTVSEDQINSRNVAVVMVTATLPPSANPGDRMDANVSSIGDARSLAGGTLLLTPLVGPDRQAYALAQGALSVGGYAFDAELERQQRNFPTSAVLPGGAVIEYPVDASVIDENGRISFLLSEPSFTTAERIAQAINLRHGAGLASVRNADEVVIQYTGNSASVSRFLASLEAIRVAPNRVPRIVINERTGTIVAGSDVRISSIVISQGDIKITVQSENEGSQPGGFIGGFSTDIASLIVTNVDLSVEEGQNDTVASFPDTNVGSLVQGLAQARVNTRRIISILQAIKAQGALHAQIVIQ
ncbi:MAG: flagellar basal body P-ring protein FlgI [Pseudomonadota bacterium]